MTIAVLRLPPCGFAPQSVRVIAAKSMSSMELPNDRALFRRTANGTSITCALRRTPALRGSGPAGIQYKDRKLSIVFRHTILALTHF
jgi:hypothetical protein